MKAHAQFSWTRWVIGFAFLYGTAQIYLGPIRVWFYREIDQWWAGPSPQNKYIIGIDPTEAVKKGVERISGVGDRMDA